MNYKKLPDICIITTGKLDANAAVAGGAYPFFTCAPEPTTIDSFAFDCDAILLAGNNAQGNFHITRYNGKFNAYQRTYVITAKDGYNIDFIKYMLELSLAHFKSQAQGSQTKFLTIQILNSFSIPDIPLKAQIKTVSPLVALDKKINNNNNACAELEAMAKTLYDYWFVQFDFPDENGKPYRTSGGAMEKCKELGREVPKGWKAGTVADLGEIVSGATPSTTEENYYTTNGIAWITPNDLSDNEHNMFVFHGERDITEAGLNSCSAVLMPAGSVLMSSRAPIGYLAIAANPVCTNQGFKSIICNKRQ